MKYGWNVNNLKEFTSFYSLSRSFFLAQLLVDEVLAENLSTVKRMLEVQKANPNIVVPELGVAALHLMAGQEDEDFGVEAVLASLSVGGDPNIRSDEGLTPVHIAAMWGRCRILEVLLSGGGDPLLIDYEMMLNAEEYALKERQWHAYGALAAFSVLAVGRVRRPWMEKDPSLNVLDNEINSSSSSFFNDEIENKSEYSDSKQSSELAEEDFGWRSLIREKCSSAIDKSSPESITFHEKSKKEREVSSPKQSSDVTNGDFDWLKNTLKVVPLTENAIRIIKEQRRKTDVYEYPQPKLSSESSSLSLVHLKRPRMNAEEQGNPEEFSGIYFCRVEDDSLKSINSTVKVHCPSPSQDSMLTNTDFGLNIKSRKRGVLRKMSRIFLFVLRKRHVYKRLK